MTSRHLLSLLLAVSACGSVEAGPSDVTDHSDDGDPPAIVGINPESGSTVDETFELVVTFSEPMNEEAAEGAVEFPAGVTPRFSWNAEGTQLTAAGLVPYPEGTDPAQVSPGAFQVLVGIGAADLDGEPIGEARVLDYSLRYKRISAVFPFSQTLSGNCFEACSGTWTWLSAGERSSDFTAASRGFLTIPFDGLPDGVVIDSAVLHTQVEAIKDDPFSWGDLAIDDITFDAINAAAFASQASELGVLFAGSPVPAVGAAAALDVTAAFADDYLHRVARQNRTQFRIRFPHDFGDDPDYAASHSDETWDLVQLLRAETDVTVTYLVE